MKPGKRFSVAVTLPTNRRKVFGHEYRKQMMDSAERLAAGGYRLRSVEMAVLPSRRYALSAEFETAHGAKSRERIESQLASGVGRVLAEIRAGASTAGLCIDPAPA